MPQPFSRFSGIFICYRRDDSAGHAGRLHDQLVTYFGGEQVFIDWDKINPGEDFVAVIDEAIGACETLVVVIGRDWLTSRDKKRRRLDNPNDYVRLEITAALGRNVRVIPVLVQGATMPLPEDLPAELSRFSRRHPFVLSEHRWKQDVEHLIDALERTLQDRRPVARYLTAQGGAGGQRRQAKGVPVQWLGRDAQPPAPPQPAERKGAQAKTWPALSRKAVLLTAGAALCLAGFVGVMLITILSLTTQNDNPANANQFVAGMLPTDSNSQPTPSITPSVEETGLTLDSTTPAKTPTPAATPTPTPTATPTPTPAATTADAAKAAEQYWSGINLWHKEHNHPAALEKLKAAAEKGNYLAAYDYYRGLDIVQGRDGTDLDLHKLRKLGVKKLEKAKAHFQRANIGNFADKAKVYLSRIEEVLKPKRRK